MPGGAPPAAARPKRRLPLWLPGLGVTLVMQTAAAALGQTLAVVAPLITDAIGLSRESIGYLAGLMPLGNVIFLIGGAPLLSRFGPVRSLQAGVVLAGLAIGLAAFAWLPALVVAAVLLGAAYGPAPPAGSRILAATAPPRHRALIFSIGQSGATLGAVVAGLVAPPLALTFGWEAVCLLGLAATLATAFAVQPWRATLDAERDPQRPVGPRALLAPGNLAAPFVALRLHPLLLPLALLSVAFSGLQGALATFVVTWLVSKHGVSLRQAGTIFALMQGSGMAARLVLGWLADRLGRPSRALAAQAFAVAGIGAALGLLPVGSSVALLGIVAAATGFIAASWSGLALAEIARVAPPGRISETTAGVTLFGTAGYFVAPLCFAAGVAVAGWTVPLVVMAALPAIATLFVARRLLRS